jgi:hypothetical protein
MTYDPNVSVTVVTGAQQVDTASFTIPLHLSSSPTFPERVREYGSATTPSTPTSRRISTAPRSRSAGLATLRRQWS